jgi:hypothetical protein
MSAEGQDGLFYPDGSFSSASDIRRKLLAEQLGDSSRVISGGVNPAPRSFDQWINVAVRQQKDRNELLTIPEHVSVEIETAKPILLALIGDVHAGGVEIDYKRFGHDVDLIKQAKGYTMAVGDLTDSFFFMPEVGEQIFSGDEQVLFMESALTELAKDNRLIAGWAGDHDMWSKDKSGAHTLYHKFNERFNAHYLEGVSYVDVTLNNGKDQVTTGFVGSHRHKGFSVYNDAHASLRQWRDEGVGSVVSFTAHNHVKAMLTQVHKVMGGGEVRFHSLALGSYKQTDRYSRKNGWPRKGEDSMGGFGIVLHPEPDKQPDIYWTIDEAVNAMQKSC